MLDWVTISSLATGFGTLVLAVATFGSVRSANRAARVAEQALLIGLRPVLLPSRPQDLVQKVGFQDTKWLKVPGGCAQAEVGDGVIYLAMSLRNVGNGLAVLHGWQFSPGRLRATGRPAVEDFHRLVRDLYVPVGDLGFWQGTFRDENAPEFAVARRVITEREPMTIDVLYGDHQGGQRVISRFSLLPREDGDWQLAQSHSWNLDHPDPVH